MDLTILVCTHDRARLLARTLDHLERARRPNGYAVDVMVVANACSDDTHQLLRDRSRHPSELSLRWIDEPKPGKSNALNRALPMLEAERVAFVDDDHRVDAGYLEAIARAANSHPQADILCGRILPDWDGTEPPWVHDDGPYRIYPLPVPRYDLGDQAVESPQETATPGGGNWVVSRKLFDAVGPFSTQFGPVGRSLEGSEDKEWIWRAIRAGARVLYVPEIVQYHYVDPARLELRYLMRKAFERSAGSVRLSRETLAAGPLPAYMLRKAAANALSLLVPGGVDRRRFHLVRLAASLGELKGHLLAREDEASRGRRAPA